MATVKDTLEPALVSPVVEYTSRKQQRLLFYIFWKVSYDVISFLVDLDLGQKFQKAYYLKRGVEKFLKDLILILAALGVLKRMCSWKPYTDTQLL